MITTLLAFYMEGTQAGTNSWVISISYVSIIILLLIPLNFGFRQSEIIRIVNISDLAVYSGIADQLKTRAIAESSQNFAGTLDSEIEKIVSEFRIAVDSFLDGYYEGSIINSYNVNEGLERILHHWMGKTKPLLPKEEKEALDSWRQDTAHSNVRNPTQPASEEKTRTNDKKLENHYVRMFQTDYEKALRSVDFAMQALSFVADGDKHQESTKCTH